MANCTPERAARQISLPHAGGSEWNGDLPVVALAVPTVASVLRGLRGTPVTRSVGFLLLSVAVVSCSGGSNTDAGQHQSSSATNTAPANTVDRPTPPSHSHSHPGGGEALLSAGAAARVLRGTSDVGVVVAPLAGGAIRSFGLSKPPHAWSTIKPAIAVAVLRARRQGTLPGGRLPTSDERTLIARAIENSDNAAAAALFDELGSQAEATRAVQRVLVAAGDRTTRVQEQVTRPPFSSYGQTVWPLDRAALFYRQLANGCLANGTDTGLVLNDMRHVTPVGGSTWGLPQAGFSDLAFKAGWGPEDGTTAYTALQYGVIGDARTGGYVIGIDVQTDGDATAAYGEVASVARHASALLRDRHGPSGRPRC